MRMEQAYMPGQEGKTGGGDPLQNLGEGFE